MIRDRVFAVSLRPVSATNLGTTTQDHDGLACITIATIRWHYLSNATCLIRPHLLYVFFVVSRIIIIRYITRSVRRTRVLDRKC